ncbi:44_t:CDS:10 [Acaulospora morrowiae]|uniref:44_t:CDS:1 n=1 Tax=Acaulospora morrowiae TaxID=94023 RepID=A0A9N8Z038_9GLOM|nr:44_t:CDS:10 [Acaulospora morrowiae]
MFTVKLQQTPEHSESEDVLEQRDIRAFSRVDSEPTITNPDAILNPSVNLHSSSLIHSWSRDPTPTPFSLQPSMSVEAEAFSHTPAVYLKFEKHVVENFGYLPKEVEELLHTTEVYDGVLNWTTGHAAVFTLTHCYLWDYKKDHDKQPLKRPDTVYKFQMPVCGNEPLDSNESHYNLPLVCIIPSVEGSKPGLLACTPQGEFRYWEDISYAMTEANKYKGLQLHLQDGDRGTYLACHETKRSPRENWAIIFGTERAALYRINVCQSDGKRTLDYTLFPRPGGIISQISSYIWQNGAINGNYGGIVSTTLGAKLGKSFVSEAYVLLEKSLEKWDLPVTRSSSPKYLSGYDIYKSIVQEIRVSDGSFEIEEAEVRLLDLEYARSGELVILLSSVPTSSQMDFETMSTSYYLILLNTSEHAFDSVQYKIVRCLPLKVQSNISLGPQAYLIMPNGGPAVFVVFPQAIFLTTIIKGASYNNIITMRDPINDNIIGFCAEGSKSGPSKDKDDIISQIHVLTTKTGILSCQLNIAEIKRSLPQNQYNEMDIEDSQAKINKELKFILEQAVFLTSDNNVPVECTLSPEFRGDINQVVVDINEEILDFRSQYLDSSNDLKVHLSERCNKMTALVQFINNSGIMNKLYLPTKQRLFWNSEKMTCARKLWEHYDTSYARDGSEESHRKLMVSAISDYIQDRGIKIVPSEDFVRFFFRFCIRDFSSIFTHIQRITENISDPTARNTAVFESNAIILLAFESAFDFRRNNKNLYAITTNDSKESWTFQPELLKVLHQQFEDTDAVIRSYILQDSNKGPHSLNKGEDTQQQAQKVEKLKDQLVGLADLFFGITAQRLYCDDIVEKDYAKGYHDQWTDVLKKLVLNGRNVRALELGETYEDYKSLVVLIMESDLNIDELTEAYMRKYKEKFAYVLYEWYLEKERYADLLSQPHALEHKEWLQSFLKGRNLRGISWIHDINMGEYDEASIKTRQLTLKEKRIENIETFLSVSKLTYLAGLKDEVDIQNEEVQNTLEEIENGFELVYAYKEIQKQFVDVILASNKSNVDENEQAIAVAEKIIPGILETRPSLAKLFIQYVPCILREVKISTEEFIEVMTLRNYKEKDDFPFALQFALNDETLPDDRRRALVQTIWRRIYINDRWDSISNTNNMSDDDINERIKDTVLYHTLEIISTRTDMPLYQWFSPPSGAFFASTPEQLLRRFPTFNQEQIGGLIEDYKKENQALESIIQQCLLISHVEHGLRLLDLRSSFDASEDLLDPMEVVEDNT